VINVASIYLKHRSNEAIQLLPTSIYAIR